MNQTDQHKRHLGLKTKRHYDVCLDALIL